MNLKNKGVTESSSSSPQFMGDTAKNLNRNQPFSQFNSASVHYNPRTAPSFPEICPLDTRSQSLHPLSHEVKKQDQPEQISCVTNQILDWDPRAMLNNLSFLEQKIHQVQGIVHSIADQDGQFSNQTNDLAVQQQLVTADLTCIIIQLISTAGTLLPSLKNSLISTNTAIEPLGSITTTPSICFSDNLQHKETIPLETTKASEFDELIKSLTDCGTEGDELIKCLKNSSSEVVDAALIEDHELKDADEGVDGENLPPGSYEVLQLEKEEILAPHTHFCMICGKGFKRDANLRMHMRGHGDEYKSAAALAKPTKDLNSELTPIRRYSCPFVGCKRNKDHKKFLPLKTILCVKNHYKRSHCDKKYTCSRCHSKKFSVLADLKTHEKHCGRDKWLCSCGTTFSRKDKLFGHVALFQGHTPALPAEDCKALGSLDHGNDSEEKAIVVRSSLDDANVLGVRGNVDDDDDDDERGLFSLMNFDSYNFGGFDEFSRPNFDV